MLCSLTVASFSITPSQCSSRLSRTVPDSCSPPYSLQSPSTKLRYQHPLFALTPPNTSLSSDLPPNTPLSSHPLISPHQSFGLSSPSISVELHPSCFSTTTAATQRRPAAAADTDNSQLTNNIFVMQGQKKAASAIGGRGAITSSDGETERRLSTGGSRRIGRTGARDDPHTKQASDRGLKNAANSTGAASEKSRPQSYKTRSRRALIEDTSDEGEEEAGIPPKHPILKQDQPPHSHDQDIDMQLDGVSPERGGSSLRLSVSNDEFVAVPNQTATSRLDNINFTGMTPTSTSHKSPRIAATIDTHSAKRRRSEEERHKTPPESHKSHNMRSKEAIPSIDIVSHMWLGFPIHEAVATHKDKEIIREHRTNEEFARVGTPPQEIEEFMTLRRAFPRVPQMLHPNERPDTVPGNYLHFTQLPRLEKIDPTTGLSEGFQVTIRFDHGFKGIARHDARVACLERLRTMNIPLGTTYANPKRRDCTSPR